jgi:signal transduction histidine kinase/FixJ family two-component response regulator
VTPLRIILLEDDPQDAELIHELLKAGDIVCDIIEVQTREDFLAALQDGEIDLILADYRLPSFDGLSALKLMQSIRPELPFIFVSGTLGEEVAIEALKIGATDYVLKGRLARLVPSVERALREARERAERKKAEEALRRSEMYLTEAQRLSHTGSFGWDAASGDLYWSDETFRIFECDPATKPSIQVAIDRTHPDDRMHLRNVMERTSHGASEVAVEHRLVMPDGSIKHVRAVAHRAIGKDPEALVYVGAVTDITERKRAEEEHERLRQMETDLARMSRVSTMAELAASLNHEIKQPIAAAVLHASACERWLGRDEAGLAQARASASATVAAAMRASGIIDRVRSLYMRESPQQDLVQINEIVRDMTILLSDAAERNAVTIRTELAPELPAAPADRVQLQQVLMNLMLNGIEAMQDTGGELTVASSNKDGELLISVSDSGKGLPADAYERIFEAFYTTKRQGTGMGLRISRRIIESHGGRLWATPNTGRGATFQFTLPCATTAAPAEALAPCAP